MLSFLAAATFGLGHCGLAGAAAAAAGVDAICADATCAIGEAATAQHGQDLGSVATKGTILLQATLTEIGRAHLPNSSDVPEGDGPFCCTYAVNSADPCGTCDPNSVAQPDNWCAASKDNCEDDCSSTWCAVKTEPKPPSGTCCFHALDAQNVCGTCDPNALAKDGDWCAGSKDNCEGPCSGTWCFAGTGVGQTPSAPSTTAPFASRTTSVPISTKGSISKGTSSPTTEPASSFPAVGYSVTGVHGTMWSDSTDAGGCEMPTTTYIVHDALAIGEEDAVGVLNAQISNNLCGQVLTVNCGGKTVKAVVASVCNKGSPTCGVDLIRKTWDDATGGMSPGIASCSVVLSDELPMKFPAPKCFFRPSGEYGNEWYASVGLFNTGGRLPVSATLNGITGTFNGDSAYFDFSGFVGPHVGSTTELVVTFSDGTSANVLYGDCVPTSKTYIWS